MTDATLHLKSGESRAIRMPVGRALQDILHNMRMQAGAAGRMTPFEAVDGARFEVDAVAIDSIEAPPPHVLVRDFMTDAELDNVLGFAKTHAAAFQGSGVHDATPQAASAFAPAAYRIRRSRVLDGPANGVLAAMMMPKLEALLPSLWPRMGIDPVPFSAMECQITAHGDGDFFAVHTDNGMPEIAHRRISYVYYFHRDPKTFSGGHLALYNTLYQGGAAKCGKLAVSIDPPRNGLMIFPTFIWHEVTPIQCASAEMTDQRLTLNGWLF